MTRKKRQHRIMTFFLPSSRRHFLIVIPRLDRGIQCNNKAISCTLDYPVKPDNDRKEERPPHNDKEEKAPHNDKEEDRPPHNDKEAETAT